MRILVTILLLGLLMGCRTNPIEQSKDSINSFKVAFYNVENLFDPLDDPKKQDNDFTPNGRYQWTQERYETKLKHLADVIQKINPDVLGLAEVENKAVLEDLCLLLDPSRYHIVHTESYDIRGIDVALLFDQNKFTLQKVSTIGARLKQGGYAGPRNILKVRLATDQDELVFYVNHWPSRRGGKELNRIAFSEALSQDIEDHVENNYVVMGDFNDTPSNTSLRKLMETTGMHNPFQQMALRGNGTATYKNKWYLFDQILSNTAHYQLKNYQIENFDFIQNSSNTKYKGYPLRTFISNRYQDPGYSDHFPVSSVFVIPKKASN